MEKDNKDCLFSKEQIEVAKAFAILKVAEYYNGKKYSKYIKALSNGTLEKDAFKKASENKWLKSIFINKSKRFRKMENVMRLDFDILARKDIITKDYRKQIELFEKSPDEKKIYIARVDDFQKQIMEINEYREYLEFYRNTIYRRYDVDENKQTVMPEKTMQEKLNEEFVKVFYHSLDKSETYEKLLEAVSKDNTKINEIKPMIEKAYYNLANLAENPSDTNIKYFQNYIEETEKKYNVYFTYKENTNNTKKSELTVKVETNATKLKLDFEQPLKKKWFDAINLGDIKKAKEILELGFDINTTNDYLHTAGHVAAINNNAEMLSFLIENKLDLNKQDENGSTIGHIAASKRNNDVLEIILSESSFDIDIKNKSGETIEDIAKNTENKEILELLEKLKNLEKSMIVEEIETNKTAKIVHYNGQSIESLTHEEKENKKKEVEKMIGEIIEIRPSIEDNERCIIQLKALLSTPFSNLNAEQLLLKKQVIENKMPMSTAMKQIKNKHEKMKLRLSIYQDRIEQAYEKLVQSKKDDDEKQYIESLMAKMVIDFTFLYNSKKYALSESEIIDKIAYVNIYLNLPKVSKISEEPLLIPTFEPAVDLKVKEREEKIVLNELLSVLEELKKKKTTPKELTMLLINAVDTRNFEAVDKLITEYKADPNWNIGLHSPVINAVINKDINMLWLLKARRANLDNDFAWERANNYKEVEDDNSMIAFLEKETGKKNPYEKEEKIVIAEPINFVYEENLIPVVETSKITEEIDVKHVIKPNEFDDNKKTTGEEKMKYNKNELPKINYEYIDVPYLYLTDNEQKILAYYIELRKIKQNKSLYKECERLVEKIEEHGVDPEYLFLNKSFTDKWKQKRLKETDESLTKKAIILYNSENIEKCFIGLTRVGGTAGTALLNDYIEKELDPKKKLKYDADHEDGKYDKKSLESFRSEFEKAPSEDFLKLPKITGELVVDIKQETSHVNIKEETEEDKKAALSELLSALNELKKKKTTPEKLTMLLINAVDTRNFEAAEKLIIEFDADPNWNIGLHSPVINAVINRDKEMLLFLKDAGANLDLDYAWERANNYKEVENDNSMIEFLEKETGKKNPYEKKEEIKYNHELEYPNVVLSETQEVPVVEPEMVTPIAPVQEMQEEAQLAITKDPGDFPFPLKVEKNVVEEVKQEYINPNERNEYGHTLGHRAVIENNLEKLKELLNEGKLDLEAKDENGSTMLHIACAMGNQEMVKLLVENKAKLEETNNNGETPLDLARMNNFEDVVKLLEEKAEEIKSIENIQEVSDEKETLVEKIQENKTSFGDSEKEELTKTEEIDTSSENLKEKTPIILDSEKAIEDYATLIQAKSLLRNSDVFVKKLVEQVANGNDINEVMKSKKAKTLVKLNKNLKKHVIALANEKEIIQNYAKLLEINMNDKTESGREREVSRMLNSTETKYKKFKAWMKTRKGITTRLAIGGTFIGIGALMTFTSLGAATPAGVAMVALGGRTLWGGFGRFTGAQAMYEMIHHWRKGRDKFEDETKLAQSLGANMLYNRTNKITAEKTGKLVEKLGAEKASILIAEEQVKMAEKQKKHTLIKNTIATLAALVPFGFSTLHAEDASGTVDQTTTDTTSVKAGALADTSEKDTSISGNTEKVDDSNWFSKTWKSIFGGSSDSANAESSVDSLSSKANATDSMGTKSPGTEMKDSISAKGTVGLGESGKITPIPFDISNIPFEYSYTIKPGDGIWHICEDMVDKAVEATIKYGYVKPSALAFNSITMPSADELNQLGFEKANFQYFEQFRCDTTITDSLSNTKDSISVAIDSGSTVMLNDTLKGIKDSLTIVSDSVALDSNQKAAVDSILKLISETDTTNTSAMKDTLITVKDSISQLETAVKDSDSLRIAIDSLGTKANFSSLGISIENALADSAGTNNIVNEMAVNLTKGVIQARAAEEFSAILKLVITDALKDHIVNNPSAINGLEDAWDPAKQWITSAGIGKTITLDNELKDHVIKLYAEIMKNPNMSAKDGISAARKAGLEIACLNRANPDEMLAQLFTADRKSGFA